ncbi:hypothetical protein ACFT0G_35305 [Streptomyces sp. NPDC057020]|uniref:hypothetical protein n=1 Tax=unclassified Streptomyces TaxID=2593676 RepID=UPI0036389031
MGKGPGVQVSGRRAPRSGSCCCPRHHATLVTLSDLREKRASHLAVRTGIHVADIEPLANPAPEPEADPDEQELREITEQVRALAPTSRSRLMGTIRGPLRQS